MERIVFRNRIDDWMETHHEVVTHIANSIDNPNSLGYKKRSSEGITGLYELGIMLTNEFEFLNESRIWDGEFVDRIKSFLLEKEQ